MAIIALLATIVLALAGFRQARQASRDAQLNRLQDEFNERDWRMRFWRLDLGVRRAFIQGRREMKDLELDSILLSPFPPDCRISTVTPWFESMTLDGKLDWSGAVAQRLLEGFYEPVDDSMLRDLLGPPFSDQRADFSDFWSYCSQLHHWVVEPDAPWWSTRLSQSRRVRRNAEAVTAAFGASLVTTMAAHREAASRIAKPLGRPVEEYTAVVPYSRPYYLKHYGLADERYTRLFDALVQAGIRMEVLSDEALQKIRHTERRLASLAYAANPQESRSLRTQPAYANEGK